MKLAIPDYLLRVPPLDAFSLAKELGYDGVELNLGPYSAAGHFLLEPDGAERIAQRAEATGVALASVSAGFITRQGLIDPHPAKRQEASALLERVLDGCHAARVGVLHLPCHGASEPRSMGERQLLLEVLRPLVQKAAALDVRLALDALEPADICRDWVNALHGSPVGVAYDTGNARAAGQELVADLQLLGSALFQVRFRDRSRREPFPSVALGSGQVDFQAVLKGLAELHYLGWFILECPSGDNPVESARHSLSMIHSLQTPALP